MSSRKRAAFTLVELLVVIAIIGILVALILAAVTSAIEAANKTTSTNNQHEIYTGVAIYEHRKTKYPGYAYTLAGREASWVVALMPYIGNNDTYDSWNTVGGTPATPGIPVLTHPGDDQETPGGPWTSFVVNGGISDATATTAVPEKRANGIFFDHRAGVTNRVTLTMADVQQKDGLSSTLIIGENRRAYTWMGYDQGGNVVQEYLMCFLWAPGPYSTSTQSQQHLANPINQFDAVAKKALWTTATTADGARLNGPSAAGVVVTFCDGHSLFLSSDIDYTVYNKLCTTDGATASPPQAVLDYAEFNR